MRVSVNLNRTHDLLGERHFFQSGDYYYAPCIVIEFLDNIDKILKNNKSTQLLLLPITVLATVLSAAFFYFRHMQRMYWIEKSRYKRLNFYWEWFDRQTHLEWLRKIPVRLWVNRPLWYTYRGVIEDKSNQREPENEGPGYEFRGWPCVVYLSKKKVEKLKRLSLSISITVILMICISATQKLSQSTHIYVTGVMSDAYIEFKRWNFTYDDDTEYCRRREQVDSTMAKSVFIRLAREALREMKSTASGPISGVYAILLAMATVISLRYSRLVTFLPSLGRRRTFIREYDYFLREGRVKQDQEPEEYAKEFDPIKNARAELEKLNAMQPTEKESGRFDKLTRQHLAVDLKRKFLKDLEHKIKTTTITKEREVLNAQIVEIKEELMEYDNGRDKKDYETFKNREEPRTKKIKKFEQELKTHHCNKFKSVFEYKMDKLKHMVNLREQFFDITLFRQKTDDPERWLKKQTKAVEDWERLELSSAERTKIPMKKEREAEIAILDKEISNTSEAKKKLQDKLVEMRKAAPKTNTKSKEEKTKKLSETEKKSLKKLEEERAAFDQAEENLEELRESRAALVDNLKEIEEEFKLMNQYIKGKKNRMEKHIKAAQFAPYKFPDEIEIPPDDDVSLPLKHFELLRLHFVYPAAIATIIAVFTIFDLPSVRKIALIL